MEPPVIWNSSVDLGQHIHVTAQLARRVGLQGNPTLRLLGHAGGSLVEKLDGDMVLRDRHANFEVELGRAGRAARHDDARQRQCGGRSEG
jgi:hypothetical protein